MSTVWTYDDDVDEWETQPVSRALYSVGKKGGRRFLFSSDNQSKVADLLDAAVADLQSRIRNEGWHGIGVVLVDEHGAELKDVEDLNIQIKDLKIDRDEAVRLCRRVLDLLDNLADDADGEELNEVIGNVLVILEPTRPRR